MSTEEMTREQLIDALVAAREEAARFRERTWPCCPHCADDQPHIEANTHTLPCDICERESELGQARAQVAVLTERLDAVKALADEHQHDYLEAMSEVRSLQEGTREHGEWLANMHNAAENRDRLNAVLGRDAG